MFTVEERAQVKNRIMEIARADSRLVAGALVGSTSAGGDRFSDLDLSFGLADDAKLDVVLADWTTRVLGEFDAVHLFDLTSQSTMYRVFMLPGCLQVDLSFTPRAEFGSRGPKFTLLFGKATEKRWPPPPSPRHIFGYAVHHLVRARICIERGRLWQAEYWLSSARDEILSLACLHYGLNTNYGRGFDELPREILEPFTETLVGSLNRSRLLLALGKTVNELLRNSQDVGDNASKLEIELRALQSETIT